VGLSADCNQKSVVHYATEILIVDDASAICRIVRGLFMELGFKNMREAENGRLAMEELKKRKTDCVVCDWNMPVMTGLDLVKAIRADDELKSPLIFMVRADANKQNITEAVQAGINKYIVKPIKVETLQKRRNKFFV
jgi:two-component system, chemotaxis family, chemotaxis protein CheY